MTRKTTQKQAPDELPRVEITVWPFARHSVCTVALGKRIDGVPRKTTIAYWHLSIARSDLAGHSTDDVLRILLDGILRRLESGRTDPGDQVARRADKRPEAPAPPLGATGGTVNTPLPGM